MIRNRAVEILGGTALVEEWEILVMHRDHPSHPGACARATWLQLAPAAIDRAVDVYELASLPAMEELDGFCSASLLVNRASGRAVSTATYDNRAAMQRSREQAAAVRSAGSLETGAEVLQVCAEAREYEFASVCVNPYWVPVVKADSSLARYTVHAVGWDGSCFGPIAAAA